MGCYVIYLVATGRVVRSGLCEPGTENDQLLDPSVEGIVYHDKGHLHPDHWRVAAGRLAAIPESERTIIR